MNASGHSRTFILVACCVAVCNVPLPAADQDRVTFIPPGASAPVTAIGEVLDSTGRQLVLRTLNGTQHLSADSVIRIETTYQPSHLRAMEDFHRGETETARELFRDALKSERRVWGQREIHAWLVKCALRQHDIAGALREFREITLTDPQSRHWGIAPLVWSPLSISADLQREMVTWLTSERESERLLAASILLLDPVSGEAAESQLLQLRRDSNPILSAYSKAQLWRLEIASRQISDLTLEQWRSEVERLRPELRSGPQSLLARGYEVQGTLRRAATEWLWLPYVYPDNEFLAARALADAAESLSRAGMDQESQALERELVARYSWSREASQARGKMSQPSEAPIP